MNDKQIRNILISFLKANYSEMRIYQEKAIGGSTCDLMMVTKCLTGFEIKSDVDNYQRLASQVSCYDRFFDYNYIVVGTKHAVSAMNKVPEYWGVIVIEDDNVSVKRKAAHNSKRTLANQLSILWKLELKNLLNYFNLPMCALKDKNYIKTKLIENVPSEQLSKQVAFELLNRDYSVYDAEDYSEYFNTNDNSENEAMHLFELVDSASEISLEDLTLDQWIDIYRQVKNVHRQKEVADQERKQLRNKPHEITYKDIEVSPGVPWVDKSIIYDFIVYLSKKGTDYPVNTYQVKYEPITGNWHINNKTGGDQITEFITTYGLRDYNALFILEALLNLREIKRYDKNNKYDERSTLAAIEKQEVIREAFKEWVWQDEDRIWQIEEAYNRLFSGLTKPKYDGSELEFKDLNPTVTLFDYQKDAVQRIINEKNTLLAFDVGAGKTYIMIAAAMMMRQSGLSRKNMFVVPNNIVGQWEKIFTELYPMARLLVIDPKNFKAPVRDKTMEKLKYGDYDGIIIAYSCFDMIPLSAEFVNNQMRTKLNEIDKAINEFRWGYETGSRAALDREKQRIYKLTTEFISSMDYSATSLTFDEFEINTLFVDEAHNYKNINIYTKLKKVQGINTKGSAKCMGLLHKVRCVQDQNCGRGVVFATGTPICNSISDAYTMQTYLQPEELKKRNLDVFDNWVKTFAKPTQVMEVDVDTRNYRVVTRFSKFFNLPELSHLFSQIAAFHAIDKSAELPDFNGYTDCVIERYSELEQYMLLLSERSEMIRSHEVEKFEDNMLKVSTDGRKAALDLRLVDILQPEKFSKVKKCVDNVWDLYNRYPGCSQLVFCDYSTPKSEEFNVYQAVKEGLVTLGVKEKEIAFIHSYHTEERKLKLFAEVNSGKVRVLIGSTFKLGIGSNVQTMLKAIHHLDVPWRPADMVQREGRILRRGNTNDSVLIYRYICEGSFDAYSWQILETKQRFISQFLDGSAYQRSSEDLENNVLTYAEVKALAIANENMKTLAEKENELSNLKILSIKYMETTHKFEEDVKSLKNSVKVLDRQINGLSGIIELLPSLKEDEYKKLRQSIINDIKNKNLSEFNMYVGYYYGFELYTPEYQLSKPTLLLKRRDAVYYIEIGDSVSGVATRISNFIKKSASYSDELSKVKEDKLKKISELGAEIKKTNPYFDRIQQLEQEVEMLKRLIDGYEEVIQDEPPKTTKKRKSKKKKTNVSTINYFSDCKSLEEVRSKYRELMKYSHPDVSQGKEEIAKEINRQYDEEKKKYIA